MRSLAKALVGVVGVLLALIVAGWCARFVQASASIKEVYDMALKEGDITFAVTPLKEENEAFLAEVRSNWTCISDETNGSLSEELQAAGVTPSVRDVVRLFTSSAAKFRWWTPARSGEAALQVLTKRRHARFAGQTVQLSDDGHLLFLYDGKKAALMLRDEDSGLRETKYVGGLKPYPAPDAAAAKDIDLLEGGWLLVSGSSYGQPRGPVAEDRAVRRVFKDNEVTTTAGGRFVQQQRFTIDPTVTPKTIDFEMISWSDTSIRTLGIYELDGDRLVVCVLSTGPCDERPTEFTGQEGILDVYKREEPAAADRGL